MIPTNQRHRGFSTLFSFASWLLGCFVLVLVALCLWRNHAFFHDDTYITLRYARHLIGGFGPVWNKQGPRVEGFTSLLHLLLVTAVGATHIPMIAAARLVNTASHLVLILYIFLYLKPRAGVFGAQLGVLMVAASWMFLVWDLGGLDAVLYATLATIGVLTATSGFTEDTPRRTQALVLGNFILAFATLARPEGSLLLGGAWLLILIVPGMRLPQRLQTLAGAVGVAAVVLAPVEIFRLTYFHAIAPNTMYAKMGGIGVTALVTLGLRYLAHFIVAPPFLGPAALAACLYNYKKKQLAGTASAIWMFIALSALFIIVCGGDHMMAYRFCLPMYSLLATVLVLHLSRLRLLAEPRAAFTIAALLVVALFLQIFAPTLNPKQTDSAARVGKIVGIYIQSHWRPGSTIALNTAGSTPFMADDMQYIDMLGLNDAEIARRKNIPLKGPWTHLIGHLKGDGASVLARRPDYIILGPSEGTTPELRDKVYFIGDYEIGTSPLFQQNYQQCSDNANYSVVLTYYQRRDLRYPCPSVDTRP